MAKKHMKRHRVSLIKEMEIKAIVRHHVTIFRMPIIKMMNDSKCWRDVEEREFLYTVVGM